MTHTKDASDAQPRPPIVDEATWRQQLADLRVREKAATRELDAIAAQRRRLPMVEMPDYTLTGEDGEPIRLIDVFDGRSQLIVYNHMWSDGAEFQCPGCTGLTSQFTRLAALERYDAVRDRDERADRRGDRVQASSRQQDELVLGGRYVLRRRCRRGTGGGFRRERVHPRQWQ